MTLAKYSTNRVVSGEVTFGKDSIATVIEKDMVTILFKMMFEIALAQSLPLYGKYLINNTPNFIEFSSIKKAKTCAFNVGPGPVAASKKGLQYWALIRLSKINPVYFPRKKNDSYYI